MHPSQITIRGLPMSYYFIAPVAILLLMNATGMCAQRGGRPDAMQNCMCPNRNPRLLLQIKVEKTRLYFRASDLQKKPRSVVTLTDAVTGVSHSYEGVAIEDLAPNTAFSLEHGSIEISSDSRAKMKVLTSDIDPGTKPIVADTVDGKKLTGSVPYYFVAKYRQGAAASIKNVTYISIASSL